MTRRTDVLDIVYARLREPSDLSRQRLITAILDDLYRSARERAQVDGLSREAREIVRFGELALAQDELRLVCGLCKVCGDEPRVNQWAHTCHGCSSGAARSVSRRSLRQALFELFRASQRRPAV